MPFIMSGKKWILVGGSIAFFALSLGGWACWKFIIEKSPQTSSVVTFSMDKLMKVQPQWDSYDRLSQEIDEVQKKLRLTGLDLPELKGEGSETPSPGSLFFPNQDGFQVQRGAMNQALIRMQENLANSFQGKLREKADYLQSEINTALSKQQAEYGQKFKDYQRGIELEYSLRLADLDAKLKTPGLSDEEKDSINGETGLVKSEMNSLLTSKQQSLGNEIKGWLVQQRQEAEKTMQNYQSQLKVAFDREMKQKAQQLEADVLNLNALLAQRQTLRFEMTSGIRRKLKKIAESENVSFIIANPSNGFQSTNFMLAFPQGKDITNQLMNLFR